MTSSLFTRDWRALASSADGGRLVAASHDSAPDYEGGTICSWPSSVPFPPPPPSPRLSVRSAGQSVVISWLVPSADFALEQNPDLFSPDWTIVPTLAALNLSNLHYEVTLSPSSGSRFWMLRQW